MKKQNLIHNKKLASSIHRIDDAGILLNRDIDGLNRDMGEESSRIQELESRILALKERYNFDIPIYEKTEGIQVDINNNLENINKEEYQDFIFKDLSKTDIFVACIAGGLGVIIDFLAVRIPKTKVLYDNGVTKQLDGSPVTKLMRSIGFNKDGKTSKWVSALEKWFDVNYDTSIIKGEKGFNPKSHRLYSLSHDPSPSGFLWALKDAITGTTSYIDKQGRLNFIPTKNVSAYKLLAMPIIWMGHIISDIFTKAGVPIPGSCFLRTLQFGSIGEKGRTIGQVIEYMYMEGYDMRHLFTMAIENAVIELIIRIYNALINKPIKKFARPQSLIQAENVIRKDRLEKMRLCGYSIAVAGNIAKLYVYKNPLALNISVWYSFIKSALAAYEKHNSTTKKVIDSVKSREEIENKFSTIKNIVDNI